MTRPWRTVMNREIHVRITDKAFLIGTLAMSVIIVAMIVISSLLGSRTSTYTVITSTPQAGDAARSIVTMAPGIGDKVKVRAKTASTDAAARDAVEAGKATAWLTRSADGWALVAKNEVPQKLDAVVSDVVRITVLERNAARAGTSIKELTTGAAVTTRVLHGNEKERQFGVALAIIFAILFYMSSLMFGVTLANSVVEEKQSRIVEIIAAKIPIRSLLAGKILGNTALALAQTVLYVILGVIGLQFTDYRSFLGNVSGAIVWFLVFFVVGFLLIACVWAVVGALSSRAEDMQTASMPVTLVLVVTFLVAIMSGGVWSTVLSYVPPFSPILMPMRAAKGSADWWEPVISVVLLLIAAGLIVLAAERLYRRALLQTQGRLSLRQAWNVRE